MKKDKNIRTYTTEELKARRAKSRTDLARVDDMTDEKLERLVAEDDTHVHRVVAAERRPRAEIRVRADPRPIADDDAGLDDGEGPDLDVRAQNGLGAHRCAGIDHPQVLRAALRAPGSRGASTASSGSLDEDRSGSTGSPGTR